MNRCIRGPYVQWCERRTSSLTSGEAAYSIVSRFVFHSASLCFQIAPLKANPIEFAFVKNEFLNFSVFVNSFNSGNNLSAICSCVKLSYSFDRGKYIFNGLNSVSVRERFSFV